MQLFFTILSFEARRFLRQPALLCSCLVFLGIGLLAVRPGNRALHAQRMQTDSMRLRYQQDFRQAIAAFTDTSTPERKRLAPYAGLPEMVDKRLPQLAVWPARPLFALSLGQSDIQPFYRQVKVVSESFTPPAVPVSNPFSLFAGNFDLAFVLIYLLPLLVIVCCYPVYAEEKESGTLSLLAIQGADLRRVILYKLLFRLLLTSALVLLLDITALTILHSSQPLSAREALLWCFVSLLYNLCWFSIGWFVIAFRASSTASALLLAGAWLLLLVLLPALGNLYVALRYPVSLHEDLSSFYRSMSEEVWATRPRIIVDSFNKNNPQFASLEDPAKDTLPMSRRFFAGYYDLLERRVRRQAAALAQEKSARQQAFERLTAWNPAMNTQQLFNALAGTNLAAYETFRQQADSFQLQWQTYMYGFQLPVKYLHPADFYRFPVFKPARPPIDAGAILQPSLFILALALLLSVTGHYRFSNNQ